jgi:hypothetical protein
MSMAKKRMFVRKRELDLLFLSFWVISVFNLAIETVYDLPSGSFGMLAIWLDGFVVSLILIIMWFLVRVRVY